MATKLWKATSGQMCWPERVQWSNRVTTEPSGNRLRPLLPVSQDDITADKGDHCSENLEKPEGHGGRQYARRILENDLRPRLVDLSVGRLSVQ